MPLRPPCLTPSVCPLERSPPPPLLGPPTGAASHLNTRSLGLLCPLSDLPWPALLKRPHSSGNDLCKGLFNRETSKVPTPKLFRIGNKNSCSKPEFSQLFTSMVLSISHQHPSDEGQITATPLETRKPRWEWARVIPTYRPSVPLLLAAPSAPKASCSPGLLSGPGVLSRYSPWSLNVFS